MNHSLRHFFNVSETQDLIDSFARAAGLAIQIVEPNGTVLASQNESNPLCKLLSTTEAGRRDCADFIASLSRHPRRRPELAPCMAGLHTGVTSITVNERHIACLLVGQVLDAEQDIGATLDYCQSVGADEPACREALARIPRMTKKQLLYTCEFINQNVKFISRLVLQNLRLREIIKKNTAMETLLAEEKEFFRTTINSIGDALITMDTHGIVITMNDAAETLTSYTKEYATGKNFPNIFTLMHEKTRKRFKCPIEKNLKDGTPVTSDAYLLQAGDGSEKPISFNCSPIRGADGGTLGAVLIFRDISESKKQAEKMEYLSYHDSLTGLYNRAFFEHICESLQTKQIVPVSIIMGDANGLKYTNDAHGHAAGDALLTTIADAFKHSCRSDDIIARWGGDEFTAVLPGLTHRRAKAIMHSIHKYCAAARTSQAKVSVALGVATKESQETSLAEVLKLAGKKMYKAKLSYKAKYPL